MNTSPDGRFELLREGASDYFMSHTKDWFVVDTKDGRRTVAAFSESNGIYGVNFSPDGWSVIATNALGEVVKQIDLKKLAVELQGFSTRQAKNIWFTWKPEDYRRLSFAWLPEDILTQFNRARKGMIERLNERITEAPPADRGELERGLEAIKRTRFEIDPSRDIFAERYGRTVRLSSGLIDEVKARVSATSVDDARSRTLGRNVLVLILSHELAHVSGIEAEDLADFEAVHAVEKACGPIGDLDIRTAMETFDRPLGSSRVGNLANHCQHRSVI